MAEIRCRQPYALQHKHPISGSIPWHRRIVVSATGVSVGTADGHGFEPAHQSGCRRFRDKRGANRVTRRPARKIERQKPSDMNSACIEILGRVDGILSAKAPGDAAAFKNWLRQISQSVAEASTEGGFLAIGGVAVSDAEKATPLEISGALKLIGK